MERAGFLRQFDVRQKKQFFMSYSAFLINGMLALSVGSLLPFIRDARGFDYVFNGLLVSLHSVGNLASSFFAGILPRFLGRKKSILLFNSFFAFSFLIILFGKSNALLPVAFVMTGLARGAASNFCNTAVNELAAGKAWILNGLHAMFSVGAFLFPIILMALTSSDESRWVLACWFMLAMGILCWILYFLNPVEDRAGSREKRGREDLSEAGTEKTKKESSFGFFREPIFYLCVATLFFYLCAEQGVIGWLITYFKDTGLMSAGLSQLMASVQWVMILAGRLTVAWLSTRMDKNRLLRIMGIGFVAFGLLLLFGRSVPLIVIGIMGFGYSMAGIYPTTVSYAGALMRRYSYAWSFILTLASLGSIIMPSVIGRIAESAGIAYGMSSVIVVVAVDMALIFVLTGYHRRGKISG